jgi:hypothetical protein
MVILAQPETPHPGPPHKGEGEVRRTMFNDGWDYFRS